MASSVNFNAQAFFKPARDASSKSEKLSEYIAVGAESDSMFSALALAYIDNFIQHPRLNSKAISNILAQFASYFPQLKPALSGLLTPGERMQELLALTSPAKVVPMLAYTFRQMAVDEIMASPEHYRPVFAAVSLGLTEKMMRKSNTPLHESALIALTQKLDLPVEVCEVTAAQQLPSRRHYNLQVEHAHKNPGMILKKEDQLYLAKINQATASTYAKISSITQPQQIDTDEQKLQHALTVIKEEEQGLQKKFARLAHRLVTMYKAGELTKAQLLTLYLHNMPTLEEHQRKNLDSKRVLNDGFHLKLPANLELKELAQEGLVKHLIEALAESITFGYMNEAQVFNEIETKPEAEVQRSLA